jgi:hypothetical protein
MNAPIKMERAYCDTSSVITILKDLGVVVLLAEENAESIDATANIEMTNMLDDIMSRSPSIDSGFIMGTRLFSAVSSA